MNTLPKQSNRLIGIGLLVSLAVNLFLIGVLAIPFVIGHHHPMMGFMMDEGRRQAWAEYGRAGQMPQVPRPGDRREIIKAVADAAKPQHDALASAFKDIGKARGDLATILRADPFDAQAFNQATRELQSRIRIVQEMTIPILDQAAANLPASQRVGLLPLASNPGALLRHTRAGSDTGAAPDDKPRP